MHNGTLDELTDEERAEMEKLQTELCFKVTTQPVASAVSASDETEFAEFTEEIVENETDDENK